MSKSKGIRREQMSEGCQGMLQHIEWVLRRVQGDRRRADLLRREFPDAFAAEERKVA
jgi:hypothetical protein